MALPQYDNSQLIENIKRRCAVPTSQLTYTDQDFCDLANDEMQGSVVPLIMSSREEYFLEFEDVTVDQSTGIIEIPEAAVGVKLRSVSYISQLNPLILVNLPRIDLDVVAGIGPNIGYVNWTGFYVQGNRLYLYPTMTVPGNNQIRLYYYRRTLVLTAPNAYGQIQSIDTNTNTIVLDFVPNDWVVGSRLNTMQGTPNFQTTCELATITAISTPSVILDTVEGMAVGDYICFEGYSAVPQVPLEAHAYLAQLTAVKCLEGVGDREGMKVAQEKANLLKESLLVMVSGRVDGSIKKVINPNGGLRFGSGLGYWGSGRGWW